AARLAPELADQGRPAVEFRQDRICLGRIEADDQARDAVVAVALEQVEILLGTPDSDRHGREIASRFGYHLAEFWQQRLHVCVRAARTVGHPAVAIAQGTPGTEWEGAADDDGRMRFLDRLWPRHHRVEIHKLAMIFGL